MMKLRFDTVVACIAGLGFVLSCAFSFLVLPHVVQSYNVNLDADENGALAYNIFAGNGMRYSEHDPLALDRGPVYPFLVAGLFYLSGGYAVWIVQIAQALLHAATTIVVYLLGVRLYSRTIAMRAQLLCAVHPILLWYTGRIWIETTHAFLLALTALVVVDVYTRPGVLKAIKAGVFVGLTSLTKSVILLFPLLLMLLMWRKHRTSGLMYGATVLVTCVAMVVPWTLRNYSVSGAFVPVHTSLGFNLIQGDVIGEQWPGRWCCNLDFWHVGQARVDSVLQSRGITSFRGVEGERLLVRETLHRYAEYPGFLPRRIVANFFLFWSLSESPLKSLVFGLLQWTLLLAGLVAYLRYGRHNANLLPVVAMTAYYIAVHASIVGWARYSMAIIPLLLLLAVGLFEHNNGKSIRPRGVPDPTTVQR
ncbi:MAG TPA: glycosyltransferase family 39 protein [Bacteroidota bacterium]|nr:glycosyltransferase family 39 protein [Bacteroidota bacterium]